MDWTVGDGSHVSSRRVRGRGGLGVARKRDGGGS
jgi:hypothetical protein